MGDFRIFADNFHEEANTNKVAWHLTVLNVAAIGSLLTIFDTCHDISKIKATRTPNDTENTVDARTPLEAAIRKMGIDEMKNNTYMTNENRNTVGVTNDLTTRTPAPVMDVAPGVKFTRKDDLTGQWKFTPAKLTEGQIGFNVKIGYYLDTDESPEPAEEDCTRNDVFSKAPHNFNFPPAKKECFSSLM